MTRTMFIAKHGTLPVCANMRRQRSTEKWTVQFDLTQPRQSIALKFGLIFKQEPELSASLITSAPQCEQIPGLDPKFALT